jgi:hypothetical protein
LPKLLLYNVFTDFRQIVDKFADGEVKEGPGAVP